jgi:hypothetical protein
MTKPDPTIRITPGNNVSIGNSPNKIHPKKKAVKIPK